MNVANAELKVNEANGVKILIANDEDAVNYALMGEACSICELASDEDVMNREMEWVSAASDGFRYSLKTVTVHDFSISYMVTESLRRCYGFSGEVSYNMYTAIHEALVNAVVHGNLAVPADYTDSDGFSRYVENVNNAVKTTSGDKRIRIEVMPDHGEIIVITIEDEGDGFDVAAVTNPTTSQIRGRGLMIIAACSHDSSHNEKGNVIRMEFLGEKE